MKKIARWRHNKKNINKKYENRDISTISPLLKSTWVSEEAKNIKEFKFVGLIRYFSTKIE